MSDPSVRSSLPNRWVIAIAAFFMQLALGAVYAWSVFLTPVIKEYGVGKAQANLTFTLALVALGITAGFGGYFNSRFGPRTIAMVARCLLRSGHLPIFVCRPQHFRPLPHIWNYWRHRPGAWLHCSAGDAD